MKKLFLVILTCLFCAPLFGVTFGFTNRDNGFVLPVSASFTMQMYQASAVTTIADGDNNVLFTLTDAGTTGNGVFSGDLAVDGGDITSSATMLILNPSGNGALTIADTYCNISNTTGAVSAVAVQAGTTGGATKFLGQLKNDAGTTKNYGGIEIKSPTITAGAEVGRIDIDLMGGATPGTMEYAAIRLQSTYLSTTKPLRVDGGYIGLTADTDLIALAANTVTVAGSIVVGASATVAGDVTHHHGGASYFYVPSSATNYFKVSSTSPGGNERLVITDATDEWVFDKANNTFASPGPIYCVGRWYSTSYAAFTANDTTPAVNGGNYFSVPDTWTAGNNITGFDNAVGCQLLVIVGGDSDCVVVDGGHLLLNGNWTAAAGATLTLLYDGSDFRELSRSTS